MLTRRTLLFLLTSVALQRPLPALASGDGGNDDGGGGSGSGGSGSGGSGSGGSGSGGSGTGGSGSSGSGSGGSGSGGSGSGGSGSGGSGSDDSGSGSSGSGGSNSGKDDEDGGDDSNKGSGEDDSDDDQNKARRAVERGDAIALRKVLAAVQSRFGGRVVSVRLTGRGRNLRYRIGVIDNNNRLLDLVVNARTGQIITGASQP